MTDSPEVRLTLKDGSEVYGRLVYVIVWEGKPLSGGERLIRGDEIVVMTVDHEENP